MDLPAMRTIPFFHGSELTRCGRVMLASDQGWPTQAYGQHTGRPARLTTASVMIDGKWCI